MAELIVLDVDAQKKTTHTSPLALTTETTISLYVVCKTGKHEADVFTLECSPNGVDWYEVGEAVQGVGSITVEACANWVRATVLECEPSASTVDIYIIAR